MKFEKVVIYEAEDGRGKNYLAIYGDGGIEIATTNYDEHASAGIDVVDEAIRKMAELANIPVEEV